MLHWGIGTRLKLSAESRKTLAVGLSVRERSIAKLGSLLSVVHVSRIFKLLLVTTIDALLNVSGVLLLGGRHGER